MATRRSPGLEDQTAAFGRSGLPHNASLWRGFVERILPYDTTRVVGCARLAVSLFAVAAVFLDARLTNANRPIVAAITCLYFLFAVFIAAMPKERMVNRRGALLRHGIDLCATASIMLLTVHALKLTAVLVTFCLLSGATQWGVAGVAATGGAFIATAAPFNLLVAKGEFEKIATFLPLGMLPYAAGAALLLLYVAVHRQRRQERAAGLAGWPNAELDDTGELLLAPLLRHTAGALDLDRMVVFWKERTRPEWKMAELNRGETEDQNRSAPPAGRLVTEPLAELPFMAADPSASEALTLEGRRKVPAPLVVPGVLQLLPQQNFSSAPFQTASAEGRVFAVHRHPFSVETLALVEASAVQVGRELENFCMRHELERSAAAEERARLGRDLHDTILQELTAARLQLAGVAAAAPPEAVTAVEHAANLLASQQRRIREFVSRENPRPVREALSLKEAIDPILSELASLWHCEVPGRYHPENASLTAARLPQIRLILAEAVANAVRHGNASRVEVSIEVDAGLWIEVRDNGSESEAPDRAQGIAHITPFSLRQRVRDMGGGCNLTVGSEGGTLVVALPVT
jgi:signal transduction histidine kinase